MKTALYTCQHGQWSTHPKSELPDEKRVQLVLCFASKSTIATEPDIYAVLKKKFPAAVIAICSTAGEIYHTEVRDDGLSITAIEFTHTIVQPQSIYIRDFAGSFEAGQALINKFDRDKLAYIMVLSDGRHVNGSELVRGINEASGQTLVTGGLAGDGTDFTSTLIGLNSVPQEGMIAGIGFYGDKVRIRHGSRGGWETFGLERIVTRSDKNVLYELDDKNALELYRRYLGPDADNLPGAALLFPLAVKLPHADEPVVRTILSINDAGGSMTFAGDIPEGSNVRFMRANFDKLTNAASGAATRALIHGDDIPAFALLISCVGRKMILNERTEEEVAAVDEVFNSQTLLSGFYSYGEISPFAEGGPCQLHNQTMTITTFYELE